jgi:hypothetical protein
MMRWLATAVFVLWGCGSGAPAKSAESAEPETNEGSEAKSAPESAPDADESAPAAGAKAGASSAPATPQDVQTIVQLTIDDEALEPYLHLDKPDRFPFRIAGSELLQGLEVTKATKPVILVADPASEKKPVLVFTEIKIDGDDASVRYRYDVENVRGTSTFKRREGRWVLTRSRVTER